MSKSLQNFIFQQSYALYNPIYKRKETWEESVDRIAIMHTNHLAAHYSKTLDHSEFTNDYLEAMQSYRLQKLLGSQRGLQFGGDPILKQNCKIFNCSFTYADRLEVFREVEWVLLCGTGVGVSVEKKHVDKLPTMVDELNTESETYIVEDSIEGWADAFHRLLEYFFVKGSKYPLFDYSYVRPKGSLIANRFIAPGPDSLRKSIDKVLVLLKRVYKSTKRLSPLDVTDIISHEADSVLSGGVRRSALIILFDYDDKDMRECKTGDWFYNQPQRARFNMSAVLERDSAQKKTFDQLFKYTKEFGEPGFYFRSNPGLGCNPCGEIGLYPIDPITGKTGFQFCNLVSISATKIEDEDDFYKLCKDASTLATIQASYNKFPYLGEVTENIAKHDPLIGVSLAGVTAKPDILLNPFILQKGAKIVVDQNVKIAKLLEINPSSRCTTIKPDGRTSTLTGNPPGCHPEHSRMYIRRVQVNKDEEIGQIYKKYNPEAVSDSVWSANNTDYSIMFPVVVSEETMVKRDLLGIKQLEIVKLLQENWILPGNVNPESGLANNVSNTVTVPEGDWDRVRDYIWEHKNVFAGVSFVPETGDLDYTQPPYSEVLTPDELLDKYGEGVIFASGLIVDSEKVFGNLWIAADTYFGKGEKLYTSDEELAEFMETFNIAKKEDFFNRPTSEYLDAKIKEYTRKLLFLTDDLGFSEEFAEMILDNELEIPKTEVKKYLDNLMFPSIKNLAEKRDLMRRFEKFACKYFDCNEELMVNALKHVQLYHDWCAITKNHKEIDWTSVTWKSQDMIKIDETAALACSAGNCEI